MIAGIQVTIDHVSIANVRNELFVFHAVLYSGACPTVPVILNNFMAFSTLLTVILAKHGIKDFFRKFQSGFGNAFWQPEFGVL